MEEIQSTMKPITEMFLNGNRIFHIPDFQRDFVWSRDEANDLIEDLIEDTDNFTKDFSDLQGYLLGNIVLIEQENSRYLVVDGQQRITTITLLFKALYQRILQIIDNSKGVQRDKWLKRIGQLNFAYESIDDSDNFKSLRVTHDPSLSFGNYYRSIIRENNGEDPKTESDRNIKEVYSHITDRLSELSDDQIAKLIPYIKNKVKFIVTTSSSEGKAFQLFEVLNDRGRSLEPMDLVKNTFLKTLYQSGFNNEDIKGFNQNWNQFIQNLSITPKKKISSSVFMKHFIVSEYGKNIKKEQLFNFFTKEQKLEGTDLTELAKKLKNISNVYSSIEKNALDNDYLKDDSNMFLLYKLLGLRQLHPILIRFYDSTEEIKKKVVDYCVRYGATVIFAYIQTNVIEQELPNIINKIKNGNKNIEDVEKLKIEISRLVDDFREPLKTSISTRNFLNSNGKPIRKSLDILKFIELYFNSNNIVMNPSKTISLEHILATKTEISNYATFGFNNQDDFIKHLNRIGNLTLLYSDENTSATTKSVKKKKELYEQSDFVITRTIVRKESTAIVAGQETKRIANINKYLQQYDVSDIWKKSSILDRSSDMSELLAHCLTTFD